MKEMDAKIREKTGGRVKFKIYPGGVSGDERDVVRKMRLGQLHAAGFSGVGLGAILPEVRVLDLPFLFRNEKERDHILNKYFAYFSDGFKKKGHILLGWAEVGPVHIFSNRAIHSVAETRGVKMWMWEGDPLAAALFRALKLSPYPLSITDVLMALQTGRSDTVYISPLGAISLQWFTKVKYMMRLPMAVASGGITITRRQFNKISGPDQKVVKEVAVASLRKLTRLSRQDNEKSIKLMQKYGVQMISVPSEAQVAEFRTIGDLVRRDLTGKLFPRELIQEIMRDLQIFRGDSP